MEVVTNQSKFSQERTIALCSMFRLRRSHPSAAIQQVLTQPLDSSRPFWRTPFSRRSLYLRHVGQQISLLFWSEVRSFLVFKLVGGRAKFCHRVTLFATGITDTSFRDQSSHLGRFQVFLL